MSINIFVHFLAQIDHFQGGQSFTITWNIESHVSSSCPQLFGAIQFPTKERNVANYFSLQYRITKWEAGYPGKRAVGGYAVPVGMNDKVCYAKDMGGFVVGKSMM